jgi:uracil-DNA glycosylase
MLGAISATERAYLTNTVFWRPPGDRAPTPEEQATCAPFLERLLELMKPRAVLLLGAVAARGVLKSEESIVKARGQWREWRLAEGDVSAPALATFHPAFLMKQPQAKRQAWADLLAVTARVDPG